MYYHASSIKDIKEFLSNAIEKYCKETNFAYDGIWQKWASYGFDKDGIQRIEEYYPNALEKTYKGVSGYIYIVEEMNEYDFETKIPDAATSSVPVKVSDVEFIPDAYTAIIEAEEKGLVRISRYEEMPEKQKEWLRKTIKKEYEEATEHPEYRHFLRENFSEFIEDN